jgi:hypothetical protein
MKQTFAGQHFDTINDLFMGVEVFLGGLSADFLQTVLWECNYAVRAAENALSKHYKVGYFLYDSSNR